MLFAQKKTDIPAEAEALPGRDTPLDVPNEHYVNGHPIKPPFPAGLEQAMFAMGCFWGSERLFWQMEGVYTTASGYAGGYTPNPTYEDVCTGRTGHAETVFVVYDPAVISYKQLLKTFWEAHDPTQGMRQGNDLGTQYRSVIFTLNDAQRQAAEASRDEYERALKAAGQGAV
ncbi:MAG TPA: peptide-methionine (S)-S-oxide reductase MsrA, partial [Gammaproteobacteria bacterium]|nr:peptide-methionine (S)-S-oxide reductase MsrA [Gammaproteobacteria bacterium]